MPDRARIAGVEVDTRHWIGGERIASSGRFPVFSPIDGEPLAEVSAGSDREADAAVRAAREAFPRWAALGPAGRRPILDRLANGILARIDELSAVETRDNGSLLIGNRKNVMARCAHNVAFFAELACRMEGEVITGDTVDNRVRYEPSGVAALITPWNAPLMLGTWKVGPALAAGNTVVLKPPEWAPLTCSLLADVAAEAGLPAGVLNILQGTGGEAGAALAAHPDLARISFTGSVPTARRIGRSAAESLTPVSFELGGKSPFIVFADADLDAAARTIARQYVNAGQVCLAGTRILVEGPVPRSRCSRGFGPRPGSSRWETPGISPPGSAPSSIPASTNGSGATWNGRWRTGRGRSSGVNRIPSAICTTNPPCWQAPPRATRSSMRKSSARC